MRKHRTLPTKTRLARLHEYPSAARYVRRLPHGLASFPDVVVRPEAFGRIREFLPDSVDRFTGPLGAYLRSEFEGDWMPEVVGQTAILLFCEVHGVEAMLKRSYKAAHQLFEGPVLKHLIRLLSPTLVVMGAGRRWNTLRRGTRMTTSSVSVEAGRKQTQFQIAAPSPVFTPEFGVALGPFLEVALERSHGVDAKVVPIENSEDTIRYLGSWAA